jgi:Na+-driven multidrug efflux pump
LFSGDESAEFKRIAVNATGLYFILFIAAGPNYILGAYLQSIGKSVMSIVINLLKGFVLMIVFLSVLPGYFEMGLNGIWLSRSLTEIGTLLVAGLFTLYYRQRYYSSEAILAKHNKQ